MGFYKIVILNLFPVFLAIAGCSPDLPGSGSIPLTNSEMLNRMLEQSPFTVINLESVPIDTVLLEDRDVLGRTSIDSEFGIGRPMGLIKVDEHIYVGDEQQNTIWQLNLQGEITERIGREGRGPGEFLWLSGLAANRSNVFAFGGRNQVVTVYDRQFNYITSVNLQSLASPFRGRFSATDRRIFLPTSLAAMPGGERPLLQTYQTFSSFEEEGVFLFSILPKTIGSNGMIHFRIASNPYRGTIAFAFIRLPYLFLFDEELNQTHTLVFNTPHHSFPEQIEPITEPMTMPNFFISFALGEDGSVIVSTRQVSENRDDVKLVFYRIEMEGEGYRLSNAWHFVHESPLTDFSSLAASEMTVENDTLYFTRPVGLGYVYRYAMKFAH